MGHHALGNARHSVDLGDTVDLVAEELHADRPSAPIRGVDLHRVAPHAEGVS